MLMLTAPRRALSNAQAGFSLIEAMIALAVGLIVIGSVLAFTVSTLQSNTENVRATRLSQELRALTSLVTNDLRRAGFDSRAMEGVGRGTAYVSPFAAMQVTGNNTATSCVAFAYDRAGGDPGTLEPANNEIRAYRRAVVNGVGVLQFRQGTGTSCDAGAGWQSLNDPNVINITRFFINLTPVNLAGGPNTVPLRIRDIDLQIAGNLVSDADVTRAVDTQVRVRADCIRTNLADCGAAP